MNISRCLRNLSFLAALLWCCGIAGAEVSGVVTNESGEPLGGAVVFIAKETRITDATGFFNFPDLPWSEKLQLKVTATGYKSYEQSLPSREQRLQILLYPLMRSERLTVTATRLRELPENSHASVDVLTNEDLKSTAAATLDDALRQVSGFSLFRRSGSRTANPTTQGVSLRGLGSSGASRALILRDGIPINDPFGGWIYWGRIPRSSIGHIEVVRGGTSHLYGTNAMAGVLQFFPRETRNSGVELEGSYGNEQSANGSLFASYAQPNCGTRLAAEGFDTDGYVPVDFAERGPVDVQANVRNGVVEATLHRVVNPDASLFLSASLFSESRSNGTPLQVNDTTIGEISGGGNWHSASAGRLQARLYGSSQIFHQDFSAISGDRSTETLTRSQEVPSQQAGISGQWSKNFGSTHTLLAGIDARDIRGESNEQIFTGGQAGPFISSGGRQRLYGFYLEERWQLTPETSILVGIRRDLWENRQNTTEEDRTENAWSPSLSLLHSVRKNFQIRGSVYRAFRAPTLNELYRAFRVGNIFTLANSKLDAERLTGGEAGVTLGLLNEKVHLKSTVFWNEVKDTISNVTLIITPDLITRRRQNLGRTRSAGLEVEGELRVSGSMRLGGGYQFVDATVLSFPANPLLEGLQIPQVPRHQFTIQFRYAIARSIVGVQGRFVGEQFEDDQNQLSMEKYFTLDVIFAVPIHKNFQVFAAAENLLNDRYTVGRTPVRTLGPSLLARFGLRFAR